MRRHALWLLIRPARTGISAVALPVLTFAVITPAVLAGGVIARMFWHAQDNDFGIYKIMAAGLVALLVVPVSTLGAAAARLSARRRDDRLATLRLLGANARWVRLVAVAESTLTAAVGVALGCLVHLASAPLLGLLPVQGRTPEQVWLPWWVLAGTAAAVLAVAVLSAVTGLRAVVISPLGVRRRTDAPRLSALRLLAGGLVLAGAVATLQLASPGWGTLGLAFGLGGAVAAVMAVLGVVGPFVVGKLAARRHTRARTAADLLATRSILDSPKTAWRQVGGVALVSFFVVPTGSMLGYLDLIERSTPLDPHTRQAFTDARTIMLVAVVLSFLLVACSVGVTQASAVLERRRLYVSLDRIGMPAAEMHRARRSGVLLPLRVATVGSALAACVLFIWLVGIAAAMAPLFLLGVVVVLAGGEGLVRLAVRATSPVLADVLANPHRSA